ncbi:uncharacterized protein RSE6_01283 [Rhynchosporium secalis]|uniref:Uncharacterized protein n=1 Tax=Rhynchosporium secalis TaxID=38038 RepID=A0A1E1LZ27_RHYSE|nr:uncharacterized protein RSE6_01283 [Rhynchosporium secalis]
MNSERKKRALKQKSQMTDSRRSKAGNVVMFRFDENCKANANDAACKPLHCRSCQDRQPRHDEKGRDGMRWDSLDSEYRKPSMDPVGGGYEIKSKEWKGKEKREEKKREL